MLLTNRRGAQWLNDLNCFSRTKQGRKDYTRGSSFFPFLSLSRNTWIIIIIVTLQGFEFMVMKFV